MNDLHSNIKTAMVVIPAAIGANATKSGLVIDRQGYGGVQFIVSYGSVTTTGSVDTLIVKEGSVTGTLTSVADGDLIGTEALASLLAGARVAGVGKEVTKRIGYKGNKRYVTVDAVGSGVTSAGTVGITAILHNPSVAPVANP